MRNLFKMFVVVFLMSQALTSCTKSSVADDQNLYEQGTEGDDSDTQEGHGG